MTSNYYIPQWEERTNYGTRRVDPYAKLFEDWIIFLGAPISDNIASAVMTQLLCLQSTDAERQIFIYINSPDGSFTAPTATYGTMRYVKPDIQTVRLGQAASTTMLLFAMGTEGEHLALPSNRIPAHQPATEGGYGQSSDPEIQAKEIIRIRKLMENMLAADTGQAVTRVSRDIEHDKYLTTQETVEYEVVGGILTSLRGVGT